MRFYFSVTKDGKGLTVQRKIFSECFAVMGFLAYSTAFDDQAYFSLAKELFQTVGKFIENPSLLGEKMGPPFKPLNIPMITLNIIHEFWELQPATRDNFKETAIQCIKDICGHIDEETDCVRENMLELNSFDDETAAGRLCCPGHVIECGWFLLAFAESYPDISPTQNLKGIATKMIEQAFEKGWDYGHRGGIIYFTDAIGFPRTELEWSMKLWWPMTEALIAYAYLWKNSKSEEHLKKLGLIWDVCKKHFLHKEHGAWFGYFTKEFQQTHAIIGGPYKGCFHVPRALLWAKELLER